MPTSIREQLLAELTTQVSGKYGLPDPETELELPFTVVQDGTDEVSQNEYGETKISMPVVIARADKAAGRTRDAMRAEAHELLAGIITKVFADETVGGFAESVLYTDGGIQTEVGRVFAEAQFTVNYYIAHGDPYNQPDPEED